MIAAMNMIIHDMEGQIEIGDTFRNPKFRKGNRLQTFDRAVANPMWNQTEFTEKDYDAGAASRSSGNANTNKENDVRRWFVEQDLVEGVIYLPENLFYNTSAPGIVLFLNKAKVKERKGKLFLLNAATEFAKGDPKNYIPEDAITRIADTFKAWREVEKYSRVVTREEIAKNDFNISPSRYIHTGAGEEYRPIAEIVEELEALEEEEQASSTNLRQILTQLDV